MAVQRMLRLSETCLTVYPSDGRVTIPPTLADWQMPPRPGSGEFLTGLAAYRKFEMVQQSIVANQASPFFEVLPIRDTFMTSSLPVQVPRRSRNSQKQLCVSHDLLTVASITLQN